MGNHQRGSDEDVILMLEAAKMRHTAGKPITG
jgi:hypothetical protein